MTKKVSQLIQRNNELVFTGDYLDIYIPQSSFTRNRAVLVDQYIQTIGIFVFEIKTSDDVVKGRPGLFKTLAYPNQISFTFSSEHRYEGTLDNGKVNSNKYRVFRLTDGDIFMSNTAVQQSSGSLNDFVSALHSGQIPNTLPYGELINLYLDAMDLNGSDLKSPASTLEIIISEIARDKNDTSIPFRLKTKGEYNSYSYRMVNLVELPSLNSTYAALGFQDIDKAIVNSINRTSRGEEEKPTPLEKLAKY